MPDDEGLALHSGGFRGRHGSGRCSRSAATAGSRPCTSARRPRAAGTVLFTIDHHRGSEENQAGWEHHDPEVVDPATGKMDTLPYFRRTIHDAGLEDVVIAVVGHSIPVVRAWRTPLGFLFIDGGHAEDVAMADYAGWSANVVRGGCRDPRRVRGSRSRGPGAVPRVATRGRRRLRARVDHRLATRPPPPVGGADRPRARRRSGTSRPGRPVRATPPRWPRCCRPAAPPRDRAHRGVPDAISHSRVLSRVRSSHEVTITSKIESSP